VCERDDTHAHTHTSTHTHYMAKWKQGASERAIRSRATLIVSTVGIIQDGGEEAARNSAGVGAGEGGEGEAVLTLELLSSGVAAAALALGASQHAGETHVTLSVESGPATRPPVDGAAGSAGVLRCPASFPILCCWNS